MLRSFDIDKTRAQRLAEARAGFPLLRGCPNTAAISLCGLLDRIGQDQWSDFAGQMSDFVQTDHPTSGMSVDERRNKLAEFPLVDALLGPAFGPSPHPQNGTSRNFGKDRGWPDERRQCRRAERLGQNDRRAGHGVHTGKGPRRHA